MRKRNFLIGINITLVNKKNSKQPLMIEIYGELKHLQKEIIMLCRKDITKSVARNDRINCTSTGEVRCLDGWTGKLCNKAVCREECHPVHGYCTQPGECKCALGWRGKNCDECVPLPGCKHGFCRETSYECICEPGWEGNYCSIPVCKEGCHSTRGYCKYPNECRCRIGWGGETCEECKPLPGCVNGYCIKPLECKCREGWTGLYCNTRHMAQWKPWQISRESRNEKYETGSPKS
ncbi:Protein jagged-2 [Armadillidium vulgare]|nr:Protein jagged-2 [Armadillidium vulgare]